MAATTIEIRRITTGPSLVIEDADLLAMDFFRTDPSAAPGGYDDLAGGGIVTESRAVTSSRSIRPCAHARPTRYGIRSLAAKGPQSWLVTLDPSWDLVGLEDVTWHGRARPAVERGISAMVGPGRGLSVATKVLHLKRPGMFPVLDSLVLQQLGVIEGVPPMQAINHLRAECIRNREALVAVQIHLAKHYKRSLVGIMDALLWASHPAAGVNSSLRGWQHVIRRDAQGVTATP